MPTVLYEAIQQKAEEDERSINYEIVKCLAACFNVNVKPATPGGKRVKGQKATDPSPDAS